MYRGFVTLQKKTEITHPPDKNEDGEDAEATVQFKYEPMCDFTISIPKVSNIYKHVTDKLNFKYICKFNDYH